MVDLVVDAFDLSVFNGVEKPQFAGRPADVPVVFEVCVAVEGDGVELVNEEVPVLAVGQDCLGDEGVGEVVERGEAWRKRDWERSKSNRLTFLLI